MPNLNLLQKYRESEQEKPAPPSLAVDRKPTGNAVSLQDDERKVAYCIGELKARNIDITNGYDKWLSLGFALASMGENGRAYFHDVSSIYPDYDSKETDKKFDSCLKDNAGKVTLGTFFDECRKAGVEYKAMLPRTRKKNSFAKEIETGSPALHSDIPQHLIGKFLAQEIEFIEQQAISFLRKSEDAEKCIEAIEKQLFKKHELQDIESIVEMYYEKLKYFWAFDKMDNTAQTIIYIKHFHPKLKRNLIGGKIEIDGEYQTETALNTIMFDVKMFGVKIGKSNFYDLLNSTHTPQYNPIKEFFQKRKHWESQGLIEKISATIKTTTGLRSENAREDFFCYFFRKWLIGCISQVFDPHAKHNLFLILSGRQNVGKTSWLRQLIPDQLDRFRSEAKLEHYQNADLAMQLCQNMILLDDDMGIKKKADWSKIKSLLDTDYFVTRKPYGRGLEREKRIGSLCATTNEMEILGDPTGNRRLIPVEVDRIDWEAYNVIDKERLWVEAYNLWAKGERWELSKEDIQLLNDNTQDFTMPDPIKETIQEHLSLPDRTDTRPVEEMTSTEIANYLTARSYGFRINPIALGVRMRELGFKQKHKWTEGNGTKRIWEVIKTDPQN